MTKQELGPKQLKWVEALESGEYAQGRTYLKRGCSPDTKYCCLGVLAEVMEVPFVRDEVGYMRIYEAPREDDPEYKKALYLSNEKSFAERYGVACALTGGFSASIKLRSVTGRLSEAVTLPDSPAKHRPLTSLADINDAKAMTFKEIAAFIREDPSRVFTGPC